MIEAEEALLESEKKFRTIFENANDLIIFTDQIGNFIDLNRKVEDLYGWQREECIGKNYIDFPVLSEEDVYRCQKYLENTLSGKKNEFIILETYTRDGSTVNVEVNPVLIREDEKTKGVVCIIRDITERRKIEDDLHKYRNHLEEIVAERNSDLEDANITLKVLLKQMEEHRTELEENILYNIKKMIIPFMNKLKMSCLNDRQRALFEIIEINLHEIISPFNKKLAIKEYGLSPMEIQIVNLVKQGNTSKEIAKLLNLSPATIKAYRNNIRKKLGIINKKKNLSSYLSSLQVN